MQLLCPSHFFLNKFVFRIQLCLIFQALFLKELNPAILLKHLLLNRGHLLEQLFVLLVHDRVRTFCMSAMT